MEQNNDKVGSRSGTRKTTTLADIFEKPAGKSRGKGKKINPKHFKPVNDKAAKRRKAEEDGKQRTKQYYVADFENGVPKSNLYSDQPNVDVRLLDDERELTYADFEASVCRSVDWSELDYEEVVSDTRVWAAALCPVDATCTAKDVSITNSIEGFIQMVRKLESGSIVYFHNLAYDVTLLLVALFRMGYTLSQQERGWSKPAAGTFYPMCTEDGVWYALKVTFHHGNKTVEFRDSLKILPFSLDTIAKSLDTKAQKLLGTIDYSKHRPMDYQPTVEERKYIQNDVLVLSEALDLIRGREHDLTESLTIGSACMKAFKKTMNPLWYDRVFAELDAETDAKLRKSYRGGYCYVNRENPLINENQIVDLRGSIIRGNTYDVNSLYPWAMYKKVFPAGDPIDLAPEFWDPYGDMPYIVTVVVDFKKKEGFLPFIQLKGTSRFQENEYPMDSEGPVEVTLTGPDYRMFKRHYDLYSEEIVQVWGFESVKGIFDEYIEYWYEKKATATNPVDRMIAKLMLNNLYGKMAQSMVQIGGVPYMDERKILRIGSSLPEARSGGYIPIGAYITAYAREKMVNAAQANWNNFLYCDTDSAHLLGAMQGVEINPNELGAWDHEAEWDMARFVRQKTYIERVTGKGKDGKIIPQKPKITIKAAGATPLVKERLLYQLTDHVSGQWVHKSITLDKLDQVTNLRRPDHEVFERFAPGLTEAGKIRKINSVGGAMLVDSTFKIHPVDDMVKIDPVTGIAPPLYSVVS